MAPNCPGTTEMDYGTLSDKLALIDVREKRELLEEITLLLQVPEGFQSSEPQELP